MPTMSGINEAVNQNEEETARPSVTLRAGLQEYEVQEAFKTLRTNIDFSGENIRVICVSRATGSQR